jgi:uncharacterized protein (DUF4415 family)
MKQGNPSPLSPRLAAEVAELERMPDSTIDTSGMPEQRDWSKAARGGLFRPVKRQLSPRIDADVLDFFERQGKGYQTRINAALREWIALHGNT